jgi:hypothetical protein
MDLSEGHGMWTLATHPCNVWVMLVCEHIGRLRPASRTQQMVVCLRMDMRCTKVLRATPSPKRARSLLAEYLQPAWYRDLSYR